MASLAPAKTKALSFWQKVALGIAAFDLFAFLQFTARGFVDVGAAPLWIHLHAAAMLAWLGFFVLQPTLIARGDVARHRQTGTIALVLALGVVVLGAYSTYMSVASRHVPGFFAPSYFLTLNTINIATFGALVLGAVIALGRDITAHPRLIVGANVMILEPALGRLLPFPLMQPWGEFAVMVLQLGVLALVARHDLAQFGRVHRATLASLAAVAFSHTLVEMMGRLPAVHALAERIAQG